LSCLGVGVVQDILGRESSECQTLLKYIDNTKGSASTPDVLNIWRLQRKGEAERISKWKRAKNHILLFHGSSTSNFIGILSQGTNNN